MIAFTMLAAGCQESPKDAFDAFLRATQAGDAATAFGHIDADSRKMMVALMPAEPGTAVDEAVARRYLLGAGLFTAVVIDRIEEISRDDERARLLITDLEGQQTEVEMRREGGRWRIHFRGASAGDDVTPPKVRS